MAGVERERQVGVHPVPCPRAAFAGRTPALLKASKDGKTLQTLLSPIEKVAMCLAALTPTPTARARAADEASQWLPKNVDTMAGSPKKKKAAPKRA